MDTSRGNPAIGTVQRDPFLLQALVPGILEYATFCICDGGWVQIFEITPRLGGALLLKSNAGLLRQALGHIFAAAR